MSTHRWHALSLLGVLGATLLLMASGTPLSRAVEAPVSDWVRQFGTAAGDGAYDVESDGSGLYVVGYTDGTFPGERNWGGRDAFLRKYDADGNAIWTRQFGSPADDRALALAADASAGYVVGGTDGLFPGGTTSGGPDAFLRKYDADGSAVWTRQFGTASYDFAFGVAVGVSDVYVTGRTDGTLPGETGMGREDVFLRKYDVDGDVVWTRQFGTSSYDISFGVVVDGAAVFVAGRTSGTFPGETNLGGSTDAFLRRYDIDGNAIWTLQFGTSGTDSTTAVAADGSGVYVAGYTDGLTADAFLRKYTKDGEAVWTREFGTPQGDFAHAATADASGVYVVGATGGVLGGGSSAGNLDVYLRKYDDGGTAIWTHQFGTAPSESALGVATDSDAVYVVGATVGVFPGETGMGREDAFISKVHGVSTATVCPRSQGYWKTHESAWPVDSLILGAQSYDETELLGILQTRPRGDASLILAHQLIAAKLNVANGSDPTPIARELAEGDVALAARPGRLPYGVGPSGAEGRNMTALAAVLDAYNNRERTLDCVDSEAPIPPPSVHPDRGVTAAAPGGCTGAESEPGRSTSSQHPDGPGPWVAASAFAIAGTVALLSARHRWRAAR